MKKLQTPQTPRFVNDLYRDLRDRRLLIPAVALAVALVAVPVLLAKGPEEITPVPPAPVEATAAQPAVLAEQVGIRDYRERLEALKSKNPFKQQFKLPTPGSVEIEDADSPVDDSPTATVGSSVGVPSTGPSPGAGGISTSEPPVTPATKTKHVTKLFTRVADVVLGPLGETKTYENVHRLDLLPSNQLPIVAFFGASPNGNRAAFMIASSVVSSDGDGVCAPSPEVCSFVTMKVGEQRYLHYQPEGEEEEEAVVYRFKLKGLEKKVVKGSRKEH